MIISLYSDNLLKFYTFSLISTQASLAQYWDDNLRNQFFCDVRQNGFH